MIVSVRDSGLGDSISSTVAISVEVLCTVNFLDFLFSVINFVIFLWVKPTTEQIMRRTDKTAMTVTKLVDVEQVLTSDTSSKDRKKKIVKH